MLSGAERSGARIVASLLVDDPVDFHPRAHTRAHARCTALFSCIAVIVHVYVYTRFIGPDRSLELLKRAGERGGHALCFTTIFLSSFLRSFSFSGVFFFPLFFVCCFGRSRSRVYSEHAPRDERRNGILRIQRSPLGTQPMCGGYSLDETHTPEIVACLIPATLHSPVITFTSTRVLSSLSRAASLEGGTDNASLVGNSAKPKDSW